MTRKRKKKSKITLEESISHLESKLSYQIHKKQRIKEYKSKRVKYLIRVEQFQNLREEIEKYISKVCGNNEEKEENMKS